MRITRENDRRSPMGATIAAMSALVAASHAGVMQIQRITPTPRLTSQIFGQGLGFNGSQIVVGAAFENAPSFGAGAAYVFRPNASGVWTQQQRLAPQTPVSADWYGLHVALSADTLVVSAAGRTVNGLGDAGAAFVYAWNGTTWAYHATLTSPVPIAGGYFSDPVAIEGDIIAVGAFTSAFPAAGGFAGREVYIFERVGGAWTQAGRVDAPAAYSNGFNGSAGLSVSHGVIFAGGSQEPEPGGSAIGAVTVIEKIAGAWQSTQLLRPSDLPDNPYFGQSVAASGNRLFVGAPHDTINGQAIAGSVYQFENTPGGWQEVRKFTAPSPANRDFFGVSLDIDENTLLVGAYQSEAQPFTRNGYACLYHLDGPTISVPVSLTASDGQPHDIFGWRVAVAGDLAVISAPFQTLNQGAAYVYRGVAPPCPADIDGDGIVGLPDLAGLLADFGLQQSGLAGDLDRDGDVDLQDLSVLLAAFGTSCV